MGVVSLTEFRMRKTVGPVVLDIEYWSKFAEEPKLAVYVLNFNLDEEKWIQERKFSQAGFKHTGTRIYEGTVDNVVDYFKMLAPNYGIKVRTSTPEGKSDGMKVEVTIEDPAILRGRMKYDLGEHISYRSADLMALKAGVDAMRNERHFCLNNLIG